MDLTTQEKIARQQMFLDPKKRGKWLENVFGSTATSCPNFAIDSSTGLSTSNPKEVKRIYLQEGAAILKAGIDSPLPFHPDHQHPTEPPPDLTSRDKKRYDLNPNVFPNGGTTCTTEKLKALRRKPGKPNGPNLLARSPRQTEPDKAAGYDGVTSGLLQMLTEDSTLQPSSLLNILTAIINTALNSGQSLRSWRKAIISMIPKKNEDGSPTKFVRDMRPISVYKNSARSHRKF